MLQPGKWYGVSYTAKGRIPSVVLRKNRSGLVGATAPRIKPLGVYIEPQWICHHKAWEGQAWFPDVNEKPKNPGPISYKQYHTFLGLANQMIWIYHKYIDRLVELDKESYVERLGCGNVDCIAWPVKNLTAWGTGLKKLHASENDVLNPCSVCAETHRKALKARGVPQIQVLADYPFVVTVDFKSL